VKNEGWEKNCGGDTFHVLASPPYATQNNTKESTMHNHDHHDELIKQKKVEHKNTKGKRNSTWCSHGIKKKGEEEL